VKWKVLREQLCRSKGQREENASQWDTENEQVKILLVAFFFFLPFLFREHLLLKFEKEWSVLSIVHLFYL